MVGGEFILDEGKEGLEVAANSGYPNKLKNENQKCAKKSLSPIYEKFTGRAVH